MCGLLLAAGWAIAMAQTPIADSPAQRLELTLVDNQSTFRLDQQQNEYTNTLRLSQPNGDYKFTAGLLNQGDNYITIMRQGDTEEEASEIARVNLQTDIVKREVENLSYLELTSTNVNQSGWAASGLRSGTNGYYIRSGNNYYLRYTIPAGYDGGTIMVRIGTYTEGYFKINGVVQTQAEAGYWNSYYLTGLNSGDQITIQGCNSTGGNASSPNMLGIYIYWYPPIMPTISVTPKLSRKVNGNWQAETSLGTTRTYQPNDYLDLEETHIDVIDAFTALIGDNSHPTSYSYAANLAANIDWTLNDLTGDFYASIDFSKGDGSSLSTAERVGPDNWDYQLTYYFAPTDVNIPVLVLDESADFIYTMPQSFAGHTVNVTVYSVTGSWGNGNVVVNGESHAFTAGSSYTWTVPMSANGIIRLQLAENDTYTCGITKVVVQSGNGTAQNAPQTTARASRPQDPDMLALPSYKGLIVNPRTLSIKK